MTARVTQGRAERTICPIVQTGLNPVPKQVRDPEMVQVMDLGHGLEGDLKRGGVGRPSLGPYEDLAFVFGQPLLFGGSFGRGDFGGVVGDMDPLRVILVDDREWGEVPDGELIAVDQETRDVGLQNEELDTVSPNGVGYESWEDNCLGKFNEFLGISTAGYENEILGLVRKMVSQ